MFDPKQFEAMRSQIRGEDMKKASEMMAGMSNEDLSRYLSMMGMNGVSPDFIKSAASNMSRMDPNTLESMKNTMPNNIPTPPNTVNQPQTKANASPGLEKIVTIKNSGNELFRQGRYPQAAGNYREAIRLLEGNALSKEAIDLEIACRSNLANCEAKEGNYGEVIEQCKKILVFGENGKAFYRYGHALSAQGKVSEALEYLTKAKKLMASDANVISLYEEVKRNVEQARPTVEEIDEEVKVPKAKTEQPNVKTEEPKVKIEEPIQNKPKDRGIKIEEIVEEDKSPKPQPKPSVTIKEKPVTRDPEQSSPSPAPSSFSSSTPNINFPNIAPDRYQKGMEDLKNMSPTDISRMIDTMKNMDPRFMQNIFKAQGIDMPAEEIQKMVNMMSPEAVERMKSMGTPNFPTTSASSESSAPPPMPSMNPMGMPGFSADNISMALNNPAMLQMMSQMLSSQLGRSPGEIETVLSCFRRMFNLCMSFVNGYRFLTTGNRKYVTYGGVVLGIAYLLGYI
jgi:tetratricopeptide (TPR) repeat protein